MGRPITDEVEDIAAGVGRHGRVTDIPSRFGRDLCIPLIVGERARAALVIRGCAAAPTRPRVRGEPARVRDRARALHRGARARGALGARASELKTSLLHAVSHDLKSPLTVLAVESEALERNGSGHRDAAQHVRAIRENVARLHRRIDNLLSIARFEAGFVSPRTEPTPAADLFRAARESLPTIAGARRSGRPSRTTRRDLLVDPSLARRDHRQPDRERAPRIAAAERRSSSRRAPSTELEGRVWVEVRDRGAGLSPEQTRSVRIVGPPDAARRAASESSSRGRSPSLSGGSVEWFARPGGGTIARLDLPAAPGRGGDGIVTPAARILVAEDDPAIRRAIVARAARRRVRDGRGGRRQGGARRDPQREARPDPHRSRHAGHGRVRADRGGCARA